jgi:hypothetical protein
MGVRFERHKPRNLLASALYRLNRLLPISKERKLDAMLDLAWTTHRLAIENAAALAIDRRRPNPFLHRHIRPTDRVLEIGCDRGQVLATVSAADRVGIDYDAAAIAAGQAQHADLTLVCGEAREYLARSPAFDVLILSHVLEHIEEPEQFLASVKDRFERIYIEVPDFDWTELNTLRMARGRKLLQMDDDHLAEFDRDELEALFGTLGLQVLDREFRFGLMRYWVSAREAGA